MMMDYHRNNLNGLIANEIKLGMMIPVIISRTSDGIEVTKRIGLNVMVQTMIFFVEFAGIIMDIPVPLLIIDRGGRSVMSQYF
jgi:hypothetical protein